MSVYQCNAGHKNKVNFGEEMKKPCPTCGITIYKFRDMAEEDEEEGTATVALAPTSSPFKISFRKNKTWAIAIGVIGAASLIYLAIANNPSVTKDVSNSNVLPAAKAAASASSMELAPPVRNNIADIDIADFHAQVADNDKVKLSFVLTNKDAAHNSYPNLVVHWKGSSTPDMTIQPDAYPHHDASFTRASIETELQKPADATGVEMSVTY